VFKMMFNPSEGKAKVILITHLRLMHNKAIMFPPGIQMWFSFKSSIYISLPVKYKKQNPIEITDFDFHDSYEEVCGGAGECTLSN
jgi:hypothetical protein